MKLKGTVNLSITVSGKNREECGSRENYCRFQTGAVMTFDKSRCSIFKRKLGHDNKHYGYLRCAACREAFK